ncbi:MAG: hypothetical protein WJ306_09255 [Ferrovum myxofaciens]
MKPRIFEKSMLPDDTASADTKGTPSSGKNGVSCGPSVTGVETMCFLIMSLSQSALDNCTDIQYADLLRKPFEVNHGDQQYPVPEGLVDE